MRRANVWWVVVLFAWAGLVIYKATELPIGWVDRVGPGGGVFPFWLAILTALCGGGILLQTLFSKPPGNPDLIPEVPFIEGTRLRSLSTVFLPIVGVIALLPILGLYPLIILYFIFYMRWVGKHRWSLVLLITFTTVVFVFVVFEKWLFIILPKGWFEEYFYLFY